MTIMVDANHAYDATVLHSNKLAERDGITRRHVRHDSLPEQRVRSL
jgi:hypothetical protein